MHIQNIRYTVLGVFIFVPLFSFFAITWGDNTQNTDIQDTDDTRKSVTLLFTGDIMLGRVVESLMERNGDTYPFKGVYTLLQDADVTIGNFEGSVPELHEKTEPYTFQFSVREEYLEVLKNVGFDVLSFANNHAYDFGKAGFSHTLLTCAKYHVVCAGNPQTVTENSYYIQTVDDHKIGYLFLNAVFNTVDQNALTESIHLLQQKTDFVIAYVHWGNEYEHTHSKEQEVLAHALVDAGTDLVVGHHPHVVQDVEMYNERLIVYSLGNFIFDQYFSDEVMEGMLLEVTLGAHTVRYVFRGVTSKNTKSQPHPMDEEAEQELFARVLKSIDHESGKFSRYAFE